MTSSSIAALLLLAGVSAAQAQPGDASAGADVFRSDCARCHRTAETILNKIEGATAEEQSAWLDGFLPGHHLRDAADAVDLIAYLTGLQTGSR